MGYQREIVPCTWARWRWIAVAVVTLSTGAVHAGKATYEVLHQMDSSGGLRIQGALVAGPDNAFYGAANLGGEHGKGTVFRLQPDGAFQVLHSFRGAPVDGDEQQGLTLGPDGNLYGVTATGGAANLGTAFRIDSKGRMTLLHSFSGEVARPHGALLAASDGFFYGNSTVDHGAIFRMTTQGDVEVVHAFQGGGQDGKSSWGRLAEGRDGLLYGTTLRGGKYDNGTVFQMRRDDGAVTLLHHFKKDGRSENGPIDGVTEGSDGQFYGVISARIGKQVDYRRGQIYRVSTDGQFQVVYDFRSPRRHGANPVAELLLGRDARLYGTTSSWGNADGTITHGTVFRFEPNGAIETLHTFSTDGLGYGPNIPLVEAADGEFVGGTSSGLPGMPGVIFRLTIPPEPRQ